MGRTRTLTTSGLAAASLVAALAAPAAAQTADQLVTFTVAGGTLSVTAVAPAGALVATGDTATGPLGAVTVTDLRVPSADWTLSVASTDFSSSVPSPATIPATSGSIWIPGGTIVETLVDASTTHDETNKLGLSTTAAPFVTTTAAQTGNTATFTPQMSVDLTGAAAGTYTATVTYSVA